MNNSEEPQLRQRGAVRRIGICLLNFIHPGLGLIRLACYITGFAFIALDLTLLAGIVTVYETDPQLTYERFIAVAAVILVFALVVWGGSTILTWRWSAKVAPRDGWIWRWYGLSGVWVLLAASSWPFSSAVRFNYRNFYSPSASMAPTLQRGDRFIGKMRNIDLIKRGDVVIVRNGAFDYVKRVVGIPGDTVELRGGIVVLNGTPVPQEIIGNIEINDGDGPQKATRSHEQFPGEAHPHDIYDLGPTPQDNTPPVKLGIGKYFMLGDNRDNSMDSRFAPADDGMGLVDRSRVEGIILFRYWRSSVGLRKGLV